MFCDACGTAVQAGQAFCSRCGKQIVGPTSLMQPLPGRVQEHVRLLGILWLALSAFNTIGGIILYVVANTLFAHVKELGAPEAAASFLRPLLSVVAILLLAKAALRILCRLGPVTSRTLRTHHRSCPGLHFHVHQHSVRNGAGDLHHVGLAAAGFRAGI